MSTRRLRSGPATGRPSAPVERIVGAPLPCDLSFVVLEALPAHPVIPSVPGRSPAGLPHVHDGVD
eukprot:2117081-Prymnesium_polylepis.1